MKIQNVHPEKVDGKVFAQLLEQLPSASVLTLFGIARCPKVNELVYVQDAIKHTGRIESVDLVAGNVLVRCDFNKKVYYPEFPKNDEDYRTYKCSTYQDERDIISTESFSMSFDNIQYIDSND